MKTRTKGTSTKGRCSIAITNQPDGRKTLAIVIRDLQVFEDGRGVYWLVDMHEGIPVDLTFGKIKFTPVIVLKIFRKFSAAVKRRIRITTMRNAINKKFT